MRISKVVCAVMALGAGTSALGQERRTVEIFETAQACGGFATHDERFANAMTQGWRDETPSLGGRSMSALTGAWQLRKRRDSLLITSDTGLMGLASCQFDFHERDNDVDLSIVSLFDNKFGTHNISASGMFEWKNNVESFSIKRTSDDTLTILWLPIVEMEEE